MFDEVEDPCEITKRPCTWINDDWEDAEGNLFIDDVYCIYCGRSRDFSKAELELEEITEV